MPVLAAAAGGESLQSGFRLGLEKHVDAESGHQRPGGIEFDHHFQHLGIQLLARRLADEVLAAEHLADPQDPSGELLVAKRVGLDLHLAADHDPAVIGLVVIGQAVVDQIVRVETAASPIIPREQSLPVDDIVIVRAVRE